MCLYFVLTEFITIPQKIHSSNGVNLMSSLSREIRPDGICPTVLLVDVHCYIVIAKAERLY